MIETRDIWRAAHLFVKRYGAEAAIHARSRANDLLWASDIEGVAIWEKIIHAIGELQRTAPREGEAVN